MAGWDFSGAINYLRGEAAAIEERAVVAMNEVTLGAVEQMRTQIEFATTKTGEERAAGGGSAGRIETKDMYDAVSATPAVKVGSVATTGASVISGKFGWVDGFEDYFLYQENGTQDGHVPAMHALFLSAFWAQIELDKKIAEVAW